MLVVGVDGCKRGFFAIALRDGAFERALFGKHIRDIVSELAGAARIGVDMPIGTELRRFRRIDEAAQKHLGARRSTIFATPPMVVLREKTFEAASRRCRALTGKGLSRQSYALAEKILEVDAVAKNDERILEVHPEVSFSELLGQPIAARKSTWEGMRVRREALARAGIRIPDDLGAAGKMAAVDDVLDAAVVAWSADRCARGRGRRLEPVVRASNGREITIWC